MEERLPHMIAHDTHSSCTACAQVGALKKTWSGKQKSGLRKGCAQAQKTANCGIKSGLGSGIVRTLRALVRKTHRFADHILVF
jgi:hypothetical protein